MLTILFLCTGNSCRSQMAEAWTKELKSEQITAYSAGIEAHGLNPRAVQVMQEAGVDISGQESSYVTDMLDIHFDYVITVCGHADEFCPQFPGNTKVIHVGFDDPPKLALAAGDEQVAVEIYRRVRDEIKSFVEGLPDNIV